MLSNDPRYRRASERTSRSKKVTVRFMVPGKPVYTWQVQLPTTLEVGTTFPFRQVLWRITDRVANEYFVEPADPPGLGGVEPEVAIAPWAPQPSPPPAIAEGAPSEAPHELPPSSENTVEARLYPTRQPDLLLVCWDGQGKVLTGILTPRNQEFTEAKRRLDESLGGPGGYRVVGEKDPAQPRITLALRRALELARQCADLPKPGDETERITEVPKPRRAHRSAAPRRRKT